MNQQYLFQVAYYEKLINDDVNQLKQSFKTSNEYITGSISPKLIKELYQDLDNEKMLFTKHSFVMETIYPGMLIGLSHPHYSGREAKENDENNTQEEIKCGFTLDYVTGLPYWPGSSLKGVIKNAFETKYNQDYLVRNILKAMGIEIKIDKYIKLVQEIFGSEIGKMGENKKGDDVFLDTFVIQPNEEKKILGLDYITPHGLSINDIIGLSDPNPIKILRILPGVQLLFRFQLKNSKVCEELTADVKQELYMNIIKLFGVGTKTNVGYGALKEVDMTKSNYYNSRKSFCMNKKKKYIGDGLLSDYQKEFKIKQLTPMIHFQGVEENASVRASEMKPKLDRFFMEWYKNDIIEEQWKQNNNQKNSGSSSCLPSLKYKMNIYNDCSGRVLDETNKNDKKILKCYFGNIASPAAMIEGMELKVVITCFIPELLKKIEEVFPVFIAVTNFGMRQRMGYGCFEVDDTDRVKLMKKYITQMKNNDILLYAIPYPSQNNCHMAKKFGIINGFHQNLKSGINIPEHTDRYTYNTVDQDYRPSILLKGYMNEKIGEKVNEKKAMKIALAKTSGYNLNKLLHGTTDISNLTGKKIEEDNVLYIRGLFGFANQYEFRGVYRKKLDNINKNKSSVKFKVNCEKVKRFPSPICYYPCTDKIYFIVRGDYIKTIININPLIIMNQTEEIVYKDKNKENDLQKGLAEDLKLYLPQMFDVKAFFEWVSTQEIKYPNGRRSYRIINMIKEK